MVHINTQPVINLLPRSAIGNRYLQSCEEYTVLFKQKSFDLTRFMFSLIG